MMLIDPDYNQTVEHRVIDEIEETRKELAWDLAYSRLKIKKLKDYVQNELEVDHYLVRALKNPEVFVKTFKLKRMTEFLHNHL
jgi:NAD-specific glutamate dehydrogenase